MLRRPGPRRRPDLVLRHVAAEVSGRLARDAVVGPGHPHPHRRRRGILRRLPGNRVGAGRIDHRGDRAALSVTNSGDPIPEDAAAKIFDRFFRAASLSDEGGSGIGLSLTKELVDIALALRLLLTPSKTKKTPDHEPHVLVEEGLRSGSCLRY